MPVVLDVGSLSRSPERARFVIVSGYHDYRSKRKANLHFVADELVKRGPVFFLSLRYSLLTRFREDPRHDLWDRANRVETVDGVACYLWRTPIHAFGLPGWLRLVEHMVFAGFSRRLPRPAREAIAAADLIFIESGIAIIHLPLLRRLNPNARIVYLASDALGAIDQAASIEAAFARHACLIDEALLPSPWLRDDIPASIRCAFVPHGVEKRRFAGIGPSPYRPGTTNTVSVGSMLFDPGFFALAGPMFPAVTFHVIGSGHAGQGGANVIYHPEMPFDETLPFIKHAAFAVAPYGVGVQPYLTHTSMKLMQYGYLGVPAVCPRVVAGEVPGRFGYERTDPASIEVAVRAALSAGAVRRSACLDWCEVADRWVDPGAFADTAIEHDGSPVAGTRAPSSALATAAA